MQKKTKTEKENKGDVGEVLQDLEKYFNTIDREQLTEWYNLYRKQKNTGERKFLNNILVGLMHNSEYSVVWYELAPKEMPDKDRCMVLFEVMYCWTKAFKEKEFKEKEGG